MPKAPSPSGAQAPAVAGVQEQGRQLCRSVLEVSGLKGRWSFPGAPWGPVGRQGPASMQPRGLGGQRAVPPPTSFPFRCLFFPQPCPHLHPHKHPFLCLCQACPGVGGHRRGGVAVAPALADVSRGAWRKPAARWGAGTQWGGALGPVGRGPRVALLSLASRGDAAQGLLGGQGPPAPRSPGAPPCLPPSPSPGLTLSLWKRLLPTRCGSSCGSGRHSLGVPSWGAVRGSVRAGGFCVSGQSPPSLLHPSQSISLCNSPWTCVGSGDGPKGAARACRSCHNNPCKLSASVTGRMSPKSRRLSGTVRCSSPQLWRCLRSSAPALSPSLGW